ncbi:MAG: hypothetical protein ACOZF2_11180 [Thermodesulfobacteriota bacterium]
MAEKGRESNGGQRSAIKKVLGLSILLAASREMIAANPCRPFCSTTLTELAQFSNPLDHTTDDIPQGVQAFLFHF